MQLEGIISIQAGENPRVVKDKLTAYLAPSENKGDAEKAKGSDKKAPAGNAGKAQA
jgi:chemotaxis protein MotA